MSWPMPGKMQDRDDDNQRFGSGHSQTTEGIIEPDLSVRPLYQPKC